MVCARPKYVGSAWGVGLNFVRCEDGEHVLSVGLSLPPCMSEPCAPGGC